MKTQIRLLSLAAIIATAGVTASAAPLHQFEDGSIHFIGQLGLVHDDNIFRTSILEEDDVRLEFAPGIEFKISPDAAASTTFSYLYRWVIWEENGELDDEFSEFDFKTSYDSGVVLANAYASYKEGYSTSYGVDDSSDIFGVLVLRDVTKFGGSAKKDLSELTAIKVGLDYADTEYKNSRFTGHTSMTVPVTYFYNVRPNVDMTAGVRYRNTDTDTDVEYNDWYAFIGAVGELFSPVIYADVNVGYQRRNAKNSNADASSPSYKLSLIYTGNAKANYYATITRDYRTSSTNAQAYAYTTAQLGANYSVSNSFGINAAVVVGESEYEESIRQEDILMFSLGASYNPNDFVSFKASYSYRDVDGNIANYKSNELRVFASLRY